MIEKKRNLIEYLSNTGPAIDIITPQLADRYKNPLKIEITFTPRDGKSIDLSTLKVELIKIIPIDITSMIKPYVTEKGIYAEAISLPTGRHKLKFTLCDSEKGKTQLIYNVYIV